MHLPTLLTTLLLFSCNVDCFIIIFYKNSINQVLLYLVCTGPDLNIQSQGHDIEGAV